MTYDDISILGIALGLGMIVGFQRQRTNHEMAGVRTYIIITVLGCMAGFLTLQMVNSSCPLLSCYSNLIQRSYGSGFPLEAT